MCGRFASSKKVSKLAEILQAEVGPGAGGGLPDYNVSPGKTVPVLVFEGGRRLLSDSRWGLSLGSGAPVINLRIEGVGSKARFMGGEFSPCVVPADGFYEWRKSGGLLVPHYFRPVDENGLLCFAGLELDCGGASEFAVMTTAAPREFASIHGRFPLLIGRELADRWLRSDKAESFRWFTGHRPDERLEVVTVSPAVNSAAASGPGLTEPHEWPEQPDLF